jgi:hypothetical protein
VKRLLAGITLAVLLGLAVAPVTSAEPRPEFKLGFKALADQVPDVVGLPTENERWGSNGDSIQRTTNGLMAWRKADNWTAFTDGASTWINGPNGVESRLNDERFPWEAAASPTSEPMPMNIADQPTVTATAAASPTPAPSSRSDWLPGPLAKQDSIIVGSIDSPKNGDRVAPGFAISGWAADTKPDGSFRWDVRNFEVWADAPESAGGKSLKINATRMARPDVTKARGGSGFGYSGFTIPIPTDGLSTGTHTLWICVNTEYSGWWMKSVTVTVDPSLALPTVTPTPLPVYVPLKPTQTPVPIYQFSYPSPVPTVVQRIGYVTMDGKQYLTNNAWASNGFNDPYLLGALAYAYNYGSEWRQFADAASARRTTVRWGNLADGVSGAYYPRNNTITISNALRTESTQVMAAVLAHEAFHAALVRVDDAGDCLQQEINAFRWEAYMWSQMPERRSTTRIEKWEYELARTWRSSDSEMIALVLQAPGYQQECLGQVLR